MKKIGFKTLLTTLIACITFVMPVFASESDKASTSDNYKVTFSFESANTGVTADINIIYKDSNNQGFVAILKQTEGYTATVEVPKGNYMLCMTQTHDGDSILAPTSLSVFKDMDIKVYANIEGKAMSAPDEEIPKNYAIASNEFAAVMQNAQINNNRFNYEEAAREEAKKLEVEADNTIPGEDNSEENNTSKGIIILTCILGAVLFIMVIICLDLKLKKNK